MKSTNLKMKNSFATLLAGTTLAISLGLTFALSTSAFAMGGGGGGSAPATPKITKVEDSNDKPEDKVVEVEKPAVGPRDEAPAAEGLKAKGPEEKSLAIKDPVNEPEDKTETKPDERTPEFPKPVDNDNNDNTTETDNTAETDIVEATVGTISFGRSSSILAEGFSDPDLRDPSLRVNLNKAFSHPITVFLTGSGTGKIGEDIEMLGSVTFEPGERVKLLRLVVIDDALVEGTETIVISIGGNLPEGLSFGRHPTHNVTIYDDDKKSSIGGIGIEKEGEISIINENEEKGGSINAKNLGDGGVSVENRGFASYIRARQDGDGEILVENHGFVGTGAGIWVSNLGKGASKVINYGTVGGRIRVRNRDGDISIENYGYAGNDIDARQLGKSNGDISIENHGTVDRGVRAAHSGDKGDISIENHGYIETRISAVQSRGSNGDISIGNYRYIGNYMSATQSRGNNGDISIENHGTVDKDVRATHSGDEGDISIANYGTIGHAGSSPYSIRHEGDGAIEVINYGAVAQDIGAWHQGRGNVLIENRGEIGREIDVRHDGKGDVSIANYGTGAVNVYHYGDGVIRFEGNINKSGEHWLQGETIRLGNIDFKGSEKGGYSELIIVGDYESSSETQLNFHVGPNKDFGKLWIEGDVTGQSRVSLIMDDASFITESTNFPQMIFAVGEHDVKADSFVGEQTVGAFNYALEHDILEGVYSDKDYVWSFVNRGLSDVAVKTSKTPDEIAKNIETPPTTNPDKKPEELGLWGEQNGSHTVLGFAVPVTRLMGGDMLVGTSMARNSSTSNNIDVESQITALTASWERKGFYVGGQTRYASFTSDVSTDRLSVVQDNEGTGVSASADLGYRFALPFGGMDFEVAPQVQLTWSRVNFDDFVGPHGEKVSLEDGDLVTGRLGLSWDGGWQGAGGFGQVYGGMNLRGAVDGKTSVNVSGVSVANERDDLSMDGKLGLSYEWDEGYAIHGEASATDHDDVDEIRADLGVRIDF